jgi:hypothetical protein
MVWIKTTDYRLYVDAPIVTTAARAFQNLRAGPNAKHIINFPRNTRLICQQEVLLRNAAAGMICGFSGIPSRNNY